jgi:hypothetical protein
MFAGALAALSDAERKQLADATAVVTDAYQAASG